MTSKSIFIQETITEGRSPLTDSSHLLVLTRNKNGDKIIMSTTTRNTISTGQIGAPILIVVVALGILRDHCDAFCHYFFHQFERVEQVALLALLFAVIFYAVVGVSRAASTAPTSSSTTKDLDSSSLHSNSNDLESIASSTQSHTTNVTYPLHELNQCLSDRAKFTSLYPWLRDSLVENLPSTDNSNNDSSTSLTIDYISRMMDYVVLGGNYHRGITVLTTYRRLIEASNSNTNNSTPVTTTTTTTTTTTLSSLQLAQACTLGWTVEFLQAFFLVADDIMDESTERRGQPCWYSRPDVQRKAINDAFLLESFVYKLVKQYFGHLPCYITVLELLLEVVQTTALGQLMDLQMPQQDDPVDFTHFTVKRYQTIVRYKTAYYSFYLPMALALALAGMEDATVYSVTKEICCIMGEYFQVQANVMDCFGDLRQSNHDDDNHDHDGIVGNDIQSNKCTWLIVQALVKCTPKQRNTLEEHYGVSNAESVKMVKQIYLDLKLPEAFSNYERENYSQIEILLDKIRMVPREIFYAQLKKLYKRKRISQ